MRQSRMQSRRCGTKSKIAPARTGITLFEVLLALAIFVGSMAILGEMVATGVRGAVQARLQSQAVIRCQSKLAEVTAGIVPFQAADEVPFTDDSAWNWSLSLTAGSQPNLFLAEVTVAHPSRESSGNVSFTLRRMLRDPQVFIDAAEAQAAASAGGGT